MKKTVQNLQVISNRRLNGNQAVLELKSAVALEDIEPGQFANILVPNSTHVFLRRPFSIYQVNYENNSISFLIKGIGEGTNTLINCEAGDFLSVIFPLGNWFKYPKIKSRLLLVGGGVGVAALLILAKKLSEAGHHIDILLGARSASDLVELNVFAGFGNIHTTTEDGSMGTPGYVTDHSLFKKEIISFDKIFTCGPDPMMKAVARIATLHHISCEVSLENTMACGYGVCLCCVTETIGGHRCVCTEGPVFDIKQLKWQN